MVSDGWLKHSACAEANLASIKRFDSSKAFCATHHAKARFGVGLKAAMNGFSVEIALRQHMPFFRYQETHVLHHPVAVRNRLPEVLTVIVYGKK